MSATEMSWEVHDSLRTESCFQVLPSLHTHSTKKKNKKKYIFFSEAVCSLETLLRVSLFISEYMTGSFEMGLEHLRL